MKDLLNRLFAAFLSVTVGAQGVLASAPERSIWQERLERRSSAADAPKFASLAASPLLFVPPASATRLAAPVLESHALGNTSASAGLKTALRALPLRNVRVQEIHDVADSNAGAIVLIQDVHMNAEAQANIAAAIQALSDHGRVDVVGVEGAFGPLNFEPLRSLVKRDVLRRVARDYLDKNLVAAPTYVGITSEAEPPAMVGVDHAAHYRANLEAYYRSHAAKAGVVTRMAAVARSLEAEKRERLSPALMTFDERRTAHLRGDVPLGDYLRSLTADGVRPPAAIERFLEAHALETSLDFDRVNRERRAVVEALGTALPAAALSALVDRSLAFQTGRLSSADFYRGFREACDRARIDLRKTPAFAEYVRYVLLADQVDARVLFQSISDWEAAIVDSHRPSDEDRALLVRSERQHLVGKLIRFELTPDEWQRYRAMPAVDDVGSLEPFERFYREADLRSRHIADRMQSFPASANKILVTGGFHTSEIVAHLKEQRVPVLVVAPRLTKVDESGGSAYLSVFDREKAELNRLFRGRKLFLASPLVNQTPVLTENLGASAFLVEGNGALREIPPLLTAGADEPHYVSATKPAGYAVVREVPTGDGVILAVGGVRRWWRGVASRFTAFAGLFGRTPYDPRQEIRRLIETHPKAAPLRGYLPAIEQLSDFLESEYTRQNLVDEGYHRLAHSFEVAHHAFLAVLNRESVSSTMALEVLVAGLLHDYDSTRSDWTKPPKVINTLRELLDDATFAVFFSKVNDATDRNPLLAERLIPFGFDAGARIRVSILIYGTDFWNNTTNQSGAQRADIDGLIEAIDDGTLTFDSDDAAPVSRAAMDVDEQWESASLKEVADVLALVDKAVTYVALSPDDTLDRTRDLARELGFGAEGFLDGTYWFLSVYVKPDAETLLNTLGLRSYRRNWKRNLDYFRGRLEKRIDAQLNDVKEGDDTLVVPLAPPYHSNSDVLSEYRSLVRKAAKRRGLLLQDAPPSGAGLPFKIVPNGANAGTAPKVFFDTWGVWSLFSRDGFSAVRWWGPLGEGAVIAAVFLGSLTQFGFWESVIIALAFYSLGHVSVFAWDPREGSLETISVLDLAEEGGTAAVIKLFLAKLLWGLVYFTPLFAIHFGPVAQFLEPFLQMHPLLTPTVNVAAVLVGAAPHLVRGRRAPIADAPFWNQVHHRFARAVRNPDKTGRTSDRSMLLRAALEGHLAGRRWAIRKITPIVLSLPGDQSAKASLLQLVLPPLLKEIGPRDRLLNVVLDLGLAMVERGMDPTRVFETGLMDLLKKANGTDEAVLVLQLAALLQDLRENGADPTKQIAVAAKHVQSGDNEPADEAAILAGPKKTGNGSVEGVFLELRNIRRSVVLDGGEDDPEGTLTSTLFDALATSGLNGDQKEEVIEALIEKGKGLSPALQPHADAVFTMTINAAQDRPGQVPYLEEMFDVIAGVLEEAADNKYQLAAYLAAFEAAVVIADGDVEYLTTRFVPVLQATAQLYAAKGRFGSVSQNRLKDIFSASRSIAEAYGGSERKDGFLDLVEAHRDLDVAIDDYRRLTADVASWDAVTWDAMSIGGQRQLRDLVREKNRPSAAEVTAALSSLAGLTRAVGEWRARPEAWGRVVQALKSLPVEVVGTNIYLNQIVDELVRGFERTGPAVFDGVKAYKQYFDTKKVDVNVSMDKALGLHILFDFQLRRQGHRPKGGGISGRLRDSKHFDGDLQPNDLLIVIRRLNEENISGNYGEPNRRVKGTPVFDALVNFYDVSAGSQEPREFWAAVMDIVVYVCRSWEQLRSATGDQATIEKLMGVSASFEVDDYVAIAQSEKAALERGNGTADEQERVDWFLRLMSFVRERSNAFQDDPAVIQDVRSFLNQLDRADPFGLTLGELEALTREAEAQILEAEKTLMRRKNALTFGLAYNQPELREALHLDDFLGFRALLKGLTPENRAATLRALRDQWDALLRKLAQDELFELDLPVKRPVWLDYAGSMADTLRIMDELDKEAADIRSQAAMWVRQEQELLKSNGAAAIAELTKQMAQKPAKENEPAVFEQDRLARLKAYEDLWTFAPNLTEDDPLNARSIKDVTGKLDYLRGKDLLSAPLRDFMKYYFNVIKPLLSTVIEDGDPESEVRDEAQKTVQKFEDAFRAYVQDPKAGPRFTGAKFALLRLVDSVAGGVNVPVLPNENYDVFGSALIEGYQALADLGAALGRVEQRQKKAVELSKDLLRRDRPLDAADLVRRQAFRIKRIVPGRALEILGISEDGEGWIDESQAEFRAIDYVAENGSSALKQLLRIYFERRFDAATVEDAVDFYRRAMSAVSFYRDAIGEEDGDVEQTMAELWRELFPTLPEPEEGEPYGFPDLPVGIEGRVTRDQYLQEEHKRADALMNIAWAVEMLVDAGVAPGLTRLVDDPLSISMAELRDGTQDFTASLKEIQAVVLTHQASLTRDVHFSHLVTAVLDGVKQVRSLDKAIAAKLPLIAGQIGKQDSVDLVVNLELNPVGELHLGYPALDNSCLDCTIGSMRRYTGGYVTNPNLGVVYFRNPEAPDQPLARMSLALNDVGPGLLQIVVISPIKSNTGWEFQPLAARFLVAYAEHLRTVYKRQVEVVVPRTLRFKSDLLRIEGGDVFKPATSSVAPTRIVAAPLPLYSDLTLEKEVGSTYKAHLTNSYVYRTAGYKPENVPQTFSILDPILVWAIRAVAPDPSSRLARRLNVARSIYTTWVAPFLETYLFYHLTGGQGPLLLFVSAVVFFPLAHVAVLFLYAVIAERAPPSEALSAAFRSVFRLEFFLWSLAFALPYAVPFVFSFLGNLVSPSAVFAISGLLHVRSNQRSEAALRAEARRLAGILVSAASGDQVQTLLAVSEAGPVGVGTADRGSSILRWRDLLRTSPVFRLQLQQELAGRITWTSDAILNAREFLIRLDLSETGIVDVLPPEASGKERLFILGETRLDETTLLRALAKAGGSRPAVLLADRSVAAYYEDVLRRVGWPNARVAAYDNKVDSLHAEGRFFLQKIAGENRFEIDLANAVIIHSDDLVIDLSGLSDSEQRLSILSLRVFLPAASRNIGAIDVLLRQILAAA